MRTRSLLTDCNGIGLIEVLVSVAILATGIIAIYRPMLGAMSALNYIDSRSEANRLLSEYMWQSKSDFKEKGASDAGSRSETLMGRERMYTLKKKVILIEDDPEFYKVDYKIVWNVGGQQKVLRRAGYISEGKKKAES